jgi:RND family efflux transporter MFP subunit
MPDLDWTNARATMTEQADLLSRLRIDRTPVPVPRRLPRWWPMAAAGTLAAVAAVALLSSAHMPVLSTASIIPSLASGALDVQTALAVSPQGAGAPAAVLQATGYVTARRQATVSAEITGVLKAVLIEEGDRVKRGQVIAQLDDSQYKAALDAARAQAVAVHALVAQYQAQLAQNTRDAARLRSLADQGLVSRQSAEQAETQVKTAQAQLAYQQLLAKSNDAQAVAAQVNFDYSTVRAPFDGVVTTKDAQVGEIISPFSAGGAFTRTGIGTIVDMQSLEIEVDVNEDYIARVRPGMAVDAVLDAYPNSRMAAHVVAVIPAADRSKATVKVRVALDRPDPRVLPDMGARVSFLDAGPRPSTPQGVLVPPASLVHSGGRSVVYTVRDGAARAIDVAAIDYGAMKLVRSGLDAGDVVIVSPPPGMHDGARVNATGDTR